MSADNYELLENLADLKNENAILEAVQKRYEAGQIYTFVGSSLIALNPAKNAEIYDIPIVDQYLNGGPFSSSAHIFSVGCILLNNIKKGSKKEFVVLTGNSGSGKTVNAYHLMRFLSSAAKNEKITSKHISALQIILDRFAGAKTLRSNNSTRCAILYQYFYQNSYLKGMKLSCVLPLELNRLVLQKSGEGNFSIFYQLCAGLTFDDREKLGIKGANQFFYLNQGKSNIVVQNEAELFAEFDAAMKYIKFSEHQRNIVYKLLAVILHLGNLYFRESPTNSDIVEVANESELKWIAFLLEVDVEKLRNLLLMQTKKCKDEYNENVIYENVPVTSIDKALDIRDSVTKTIYQELFNWILDHVSMLLGWNLDLEENSELNVVSVVDLYGFTRYNTNHFDEFCVNSANEQLHHLFIQQTFKNLLQSYENENIASDYSMPNGLDNERVVGMLFYRPCGLFPLLNDESKFPKGTNEAFLQRAGINHLDKSIFAKPRSKDRLEFGIKHYAGMTYYSVEDFLENNKWSKVGGVHDLISSSNDPLLAYMMKAEDSNQDRTIYLAEELFQAIDRLCELMSNHTIHFIKCIQVNMDGKSASFEANFVGKQMKALKIQEHYRLSQYAFPCKFGFEDFISNYRCLLPIEVISYEEPQKLVSDILHGQGNRFDGDYLIGSHNVYLKENLVKQLDFAKQQLQNVSALILQRNVRKYLIRKSYKKKINAAVTVQTAIRGWIARKLFEELKQERMEKMNPPVPTFPPPPPTEDQSKAKQCGKRFLGGFKTTTNYLPLDHKIQEPITESMSLEEFAEIYLKNHILGARREPILSPFLFKETEEMFQMSLQIFKLILKYTTDFGSTPNQYYDFAKSIIQFGIDNLDQRDEIYVQLCNQTYDNKSIEQTKKTWDLLLMAVNSFPPGALTFPMLKDYFGQQTETLRSNLLRGLYRPLRHPENNRSRLFAPTILEQQAAIKRQSTVVQIRLPTKEVVNVEIDAVTTSDEIVDRCLRMKGLVDVEGWGLNVETADFNGVISNGSFIFDGLSQFEALTNENDYLVKFKTFFKSNDDQSSNAVNDAEILRKSIGMMKSNGKYRVTPEEYAKMSVASRIRNMKIPASNGDVNKFLDEVFDQVLPPNEEFASALAASIKGGALYDAYSTDPNPNSWRQHYLPNSYDSPNRQNANSVISSINLSNHDGRDSRSTLYSPQDYPRTLHSPRDMSRVLFSPSSMNDERVSRMYMNDDEYFRNSTDNLQTRPPTTMAVSSTEPFRPSSNNHGEKNRLGQLTPTSQRARYIGNSNPSSNIRQIVKRFESPAMERKLKHSPSSPSRSKSTPRSFAAPVDTAHPVVHPSQTEENFTDARSPRQYAHPRSTSSTPHRVFSPDMNNDIHTARVEAVRKLHRNAAGLPPTSPPMPRIPMHKQQPQTFDQPANKHQNQNIKNDNVNGHIQKTVNHQAEKPVDNGRWVYDCEVDREQPLNLSFSQMSGKTNGFDDNLNQSNYADFVPKYEPQTPNSPAVTYIEEPWQLTIRREVFYPGEKLDDLDTIDLIFAQIIADCRKSNPHRIRQFEKDRINFILNKHQVPVESLNNASEISTNIKTEIINEVRKWPLYFCRMYPVILEKENVRTFMVFAVGENGIRLMTRNVENLEDPMVPQEHFDFSNIAEVLFEPPETIKLITKHEIVTKLTCKQARQAVEFIHRFLQNSQQQKVFVSALVDYQIRKPNLLSFHRGDIIQIVKEKGQDGPPAAGNWLYGKIGNRFGWFPAEYVDYVQPDKSELELGSEIYASNSITNSFYAPPSHFKTNSTILYGSVNQKPENVYSVLEDQNAVYGIPRAERLTMAEFAIKYFRQPKNSNFGSLTLGRKEKEWTWQDILDKIKFVDKPISHSLLNLGSNELDRLAVDLFVCVMRYMSDLGMKKGQTITDCVYEILSTCHNSPMLIDEVYCQIIKQTTSNRSPKTDSLLLGWRLFTIFTAYFPASEVFQPYLLKHLTDIAEDPRRPFNGTANLCLLNYQQTLRYGGRKFILTASEIEAITGGKNVRRQAYELPGGVKKYISTRTVTVAEEIIKELCLEMNIFSEAEQHEFTVCYILENDNSLRVLNNDEYILDVISELDSRNENFTLILTRTVWIYPLREDNELYINTLFFQMVPNYMAGLLTILPANPTSVLPARTLDDAATLGALLYFASDAPRDDLTANIVSSVIPRTVNERSRLSAANWLSRINHKISILPPDFNEQKARLAFLKYIEHWSLYGSSFYFVSNCELPNKTFGRPVLAINKNGLKILDANSMEVLWSCSISEIRSSRKYVDHNVGFLDVHINESHSKNPTVLIVETDSGSEIARVIGQYIYLNKQKPSYNHRHDI